jgi:hypothetical protein
MYISSIVWLFKFLAASHIKGYYEENNRIFFISKKKTIRFEKV